MCVCVFFFNNTTAAHVEYYIREDQIIVNSIMYNLYNRIAIKTIFVRNVKIKNLRLGGGYCMEEKACRRLLQLWHVGN